MSGLIDSTEMYLRTLYELMEEGIPPLRARLVERLHISAPAASEATARLAHDGLVELRDDRTVHLTDEGLARATAVMRKHRLAERLLIDVIGLDWALVHNEACRWEHVISDAVEARLVEVLGDPQTCPHGNPIPAPAAASTREPHGIAPLTLLAAAGARGDHEVTVNRISELLQTDEIAMRQLRAAGLVPGARLSVHACSGGVEVRARVDGAEADRPGASAPRPTSAAEGLVALLATRLPAATVPAGTADAEPGELDLIVSESTGFSLPSGTAALVYVDV